MNDTLTRGERIAFTLSLLLLAVAICLLVTGCSYNKSLGRVQHVDGSGYTEFRAIGAGGLIRPGVVCVIASTYGSNAPTVLVQASGPASIPSLTGAAANAAALATVLRPSENKSTTTINQSAPASPPPSDDRHDSRWHPPDHGTPDHGNRGR